MRPTRDAWFLDMADLVGRRATCLRRSVGAVLVDWRGQVLSTGYNGRAAGLPHCNEPTCDFPVDLRHENKCYGNACAGAFAASGTNLDACEAIHAEQNALLQCGDVHTIDTAYITISSCVTCTKLLLNTSCRRIVFRKPYVIIEPSRKLWTDAGREWVCVEP